ncbi:MAG: hypothetical protein JWP35_4661 [Caulobacter sp.]|nr:hypothetical protein [Caulobacter sp.]
MAFGAKPNVQTAPPPPTVDQAKIDADRADLVRKRQGAAATYVSTPGGRTVGGVATKMILGQGG